MTLFLRPNADPADQDRSRFQMMERAAELTDLASIEARDADAFLAAAEHERIKSAFYYFPSLYFDAWSRTHMLRWERHAGSILVYLIRQRRDSSGAKANAQMSLYFPPFPFDPAALRHALRRMRDFNSKRSSKIVIVQEAQVLRIAREGFVISLRCEEFIYDRAAVMALEGSGFRKLRQEMARALRQGMVETRPFTPADQPACLALAEAWRQRLVANRMKIGVAYRHMAACLTVADPFPPSLLKGLVVKVDGEARGFAFSGPITSTMGCNYLCITDLSLPGLALLLRYHLMARFPDLIHFNDAHDAGRPELRNLKQRFSPVEMHGVFSAQERWTSE
ncbi:phosphatidylglycerol lysyltransferase domain-containing protein [Microvirga sp. 2YAF29]|uniref:phosphatidylglycerol lysyltransferase domain-containing protein n=1 Tax=Microvirga sp. 2YAF29 TaxID=3233031 RepID=UPI003F9BDC2F